MYWTGTVLVVSHTTGGGGVRASDVTHYFPTSQNYYFFCKNGSKRAERSYTFSEKLRVLGGVVVSASDIISLTSTVLTRFAVFSSSSSWPWSSYRVKADHTVPPHTSNVTVVPSCYIQVGGTHC